MIFDVFATVLLVVEYFARPPFRYRLPTLNIASSHASSGCGVESSWQFDSTNHANITMGGRSFLVHIPPSYIATTPHALVLSYHGFGEDDLNQEKISGLSQQGLKINGKVRTHRFKLVIINRICRVSLQVRDKQMHIYQLDCYECVLIVYPNAQFGPGRSGNESVRAWQGAPYSPASRSEFLVDEQTDDVSIL
jgi:hypothetical protein